MKIWISHKATMLTAVLAMVFMISALFVSPRIFLENLRLVQAALSIAVAVAYIPFAWRVFVSPDAEGQQQLAMGIALTFMGSAINGLWMLGWRLAGKPIWMLDSDIQAFSVYLICIGASMHLTAPGTIRNEVPRRNWIILGCCIGAGAALAVALLTYDPQLNDWAQWLEQYFSHDYRRPLLEIR